MQLFVHRRLFETKKDLNTHTFRLRFLINDFWNCLLCNSSGSLLSRCCAIKLVHQFWSGSVLVPKRHFWYWSGSGVMIINTSLYRSGLVSVCIWCNKVLVWFRTMSPFFHFEHPGLHSCSWTTLIFYDSLNSDILVDLIFGSFLSVWGPNGLVWGSE